MEANETQLPQDEEAYRLHLSGMTVREIARHLGKSKNTIQNWINRIRAENIELYKSSREQLIADRVDSLQNIKKLAMSAFLTNFDAAYLNTAKACEADIAKLFGLGQPELDMRGGSINITYVNDWRKDA